MARPLDPQGDDRFVRDVSGADLRTADTSPGFTARRHFGDTGLFRKPQLMNGVMGSQGSYCQVGFAFAAHEGRTWSCRLPLVSEVKSACF